MSLVLGVTCVGLLALAIAWTVLRIREGLLPSAGCVGSVLSAMVVAAAWRAGDLGWLWRMPQVMVLLWIVATILIGWSLLNTTHPPSKWCGAGALLLNTTAFLAFMWIATVSAGGV